MEKNKEDRRKNNGKNLTLEMKSKGGKRAVLSNKRNALGVFIGKS